MGTFVPRPLHVRHIDHWRALKGQWPGYTRVILGRPGPSDAIKAFQWCAEQPGGFYRSEGNEVWYFEDPTVATLFKLWWAGRDDA